MAEGIGQLCDDLGVEPSDIALVSTRACQHTGDTVESVSTQAGHGNLTTCVCVLLARSQPIVDGTQECVCISGVRRRTCGLACLLLLARTRACTHTGCRQSHCHVECPVLFACPCPAACAELPLVSAHHV